MERDPRRAVAGNAVGGQPYLLRLPHSQKNGPRASGWFPRPDRRGLWPTHPKQVTPAPAAGRRVPGSGPPDEVERGGTELLPSHERRRPGAVITMTAMPPEPDFELSEEPGPDPAAAHHPAAGLPTGRLPASRFTPGFPVTAKLPVTARLPAPGIPVTPRLPATAGLRAAAGPPAAARAVRAGPGRTAATPPVSPLRIITGVMWAAIAVILRGRHGPGILSPHIRGSRCLPRRRHRRRLVRLSRLEVQGPPVLPL